MFYSETGSTDPYYNLAYEEYILKNRTEGDWLLLWQNENTVVVGLNQNTIEEIDPAFIAGHRVNVARRSTGGGAVYHDLGNLNYSFITDAGNAESMSVRRFAEIVCRALGAMGVKAEPSGRNDITIDGKKVSGTAQRLYGRRLLHHGTLLFDSDGAMIAGALRADPEKFASKSAKSVKSRVANIRSYLPSEMTLADFWIELRRELTAGSAQTCTLDEAELAQVRRLVDEKYRTWDWNYGRSPEYTLKNRRRLPGGTLEVRADVRNGRIDDIAFFGDFMARMPLDGLCAALCACRYERSAVASVLCGFELGQLFGAIDAGELLDTMLL